MVSMKAARKKLAANIEDKVHLEKALKRFGRKRESIGRLMNTAPF